MKYRFAPPIRGQGMIEFALLVPVLAILIAGVVDVGRGFHARVTLTNAVREGARYAASHPLTAVGELNTTEIRDVVLEELAETSLRSLPRTDIAVTAESHGSPGTSMTVTANFNFRPLLGAVLGIRAVPVRAQATMAVL